MWALLLQNSEGRIQRDQYMDMGEWDFVNVICRPGRNRKGEYWPVPRGDKTEGPPIATAIGAGEGGFKKIFFASCKARGLTDEKAKELWEQHHGADRRRRVRPQDR